IDAEHRDRRDHHCSDEVEHGSLRWIECIYTYLSTTWRLSSSSLRGGAADEAIQSELVALDCFAEPGIGPRFARTRWFAMTVNQYLLSLSSHHPLRQHMQRADTVLANCLCGSGLRLAPQRQCLRDRRLPLRGD